MKGQLYDGDAMFIECPGCPRCLTEGRLILIVPREEGEQLLARTASKPADLAVAVHGGGLPPGPVPPARRPAVRPGGRKCPPDCHAHPPAVKTCEPDCREHRNHIYIICYGKPVKVRDRDYLRADGNAWGSGYPITHYVGFTTQLPVDRVRQHAALSAHYLVEVRPGWETDELNAKLYEKCPRCGGSLWYFAESPTYKRRYRRQAIRELRRQRQRLIELRRQRRTIPPDDVPTA